MADPLNPERINMEQTDKKIPANELKEQIQARLGQQLRSARERRELSIGEASEQLKIRKVYLQALEIGDWNNLPEEVYSLAFLRQYAALLGEDCHEDVEALKSSDYQLTRPYTIPDPPIAPNKMWAMAAAVLFVLLFILFNTVRDGGNKAPPPKVSVAGTSLVPVKGTSTKHVTPEGSVKKSTPLMPPSPAVSSGVTPSSSNTNPVTLLQTKKTIPVTTTTTEKITEMHHYRLTAIKSSAWLQVRDPSETLLKEALLHPGQSLLLESKAPFLTVTCGNAAALKIEVDHILYAAAGTLGAQGKVLRAFRIDASGHDRSPKIRH